MASFDCRPKSVCRIDEGSTNRFLENERAVEDFLKTIEPRYNRALDTMRQGKPDTDSIYVIAGFIAYVATCSPGAMRIHADQVAANVHATALLLDAQGKFDPPPKSMGVSSLSEALQSGLVAVKIDEKFPQAIGISVITDLTLLLGNFSWELITNTTGSAFLTSDYPVAIEPNETPGIFNRVVPLAPDIAVRLLPRHEARQIKGEMKFPLFRHRTINATHGQVRTINLSTVRCAEDSIFSPQLSAWIKPFVDRNRRFGIVPHSVRHKTNGGYLTVSSMKVEELRA